MIGVGNSLQLDMFLNSEAADRGSVWHHFVMMMDDGASGFVWRTAAFTVGQRGPREKVVRNSV